jgi:hypothetical protein
MKTIENLPPQGFRDFDLPVEHLLDERHYVPPKSHDTAEIARRRDLNAGTLRYEKQARGLVVARTILHELSEEEGLLFATNMLAVAGLNSAWYSYAQRRVDVMRRRLKLPIMLHARNRAPHTILEDVDEILGCAQKNADNLVIALECQPEKVDQRQHSVGRATGNAALHLATFGAVSRGEFPKPQYDSDEDTILNDEVMQSHVRSIALSTLSDARNAHRTIGAHPSIAQLADPYSHLSVYWHRHAPGSAQNAIVESLNAIGAH